MIAFQSATDDDFDIFTMPADGGDRTPLPSTEGFDGFPAWAPDGRQIASTWMDASSGYYTA